MTEGWSGVVLAGAPGAGKRTTAFALTTLGRRYERFPALTTARVSTVDIETATAGRLSAVEAARLVDRAVQQHDGHPTPRLTGTE